MNGRMMCTLTTVVCLYAACFARSALPELTLVRNGEPLAVLVVNSNATRVVQLAALELQWHIEQITGARLSITNAPEAGKAAIVVGAHPLAKAAGLTGWKPQEYALHFAADTIFLVGDDNPKTGKVIYDLNTQWAFTSWPAMDEAQGTLHATYVFLESYAGVRWWNPTEFGADLPRSKTLTVTGVNRRRQPAFSYREIPSMGMAEGYDRHTQYWHRDDPEYKAYLALAYPQMQGRWEAVSSVWRGWMQLWLMRMRLGGSEHYRAGHSFYGWYERFLEKDNAHFEAYRPQLFAQGYDELKAPPNLCFSNPETVAQAVADARRYFDEGGYTWRQRGMGQLGYFWGEDYFAVVPMDSAHCQCAACLALRGAKSPFFSRGEHSNEVFGFANQVARELKKTHPDKYLTTLAYAGYARYPDRVRLEDNIAVQVCLHARHVYDRAIQTNDLEILREWVEKDPGRRVYLWLFYGFPKEMGDNAKPRWPVFPGFFARHIGASFKLYHELGIRGAYFCGFAQGLDAYLTLRMLHDPTESADAIVDEYFGRQYGAAGDPLKRFYRLVEETYGDPANYTPPAEVRGQPNTPGIIGHQTKSIAWGQLGTPERMDALEALMLEARALAQTDIEKRRVALFDLSIWQYMRRAVYETKTIPNLERWPEHPATMVRDRRPAFAEGNALRGKPFVLETAGALAIADPEARAKPGVPFTSLTDGRGEPPVSFYVPPAAQSNTPSVALRCDLGAVPDHGRDLRELRVFWSIVDGHWPAAFRFEARAAASGDWQPISRDFVFGEGQSMPGSYCKVTVPFPPGAVTDFDALRLVDNGNRMIAEAGWHWMHATRFMEIEAAIAPITDSVARKP